MTSEQAKTALANRIAASPEFERSLHRPEITEAEDEESDEADSVDQNAVLYDEIDSSRTLNEEVGALILQGPNNPLVNQTDVEPDNDVHIVGSNMERYTGCEFSATKEWMEWDATSHM